MGQTVTLVRLGGSPTFASLNVNGPTNLSGSFNTSGSLNVSGSIFASGSLVVSGSIIAQSLIVNSTSYYSGSNIFGNSPSNTQVFTGSMYVGGSISGSVFYGSGANLTSIPNSATTATNANTANAIVSRDASGNFSAGTITAALSGNASTATQTNVTLTGTNVADVVYAAIADNDFARIRVGGTATNAGYLELATADDGTEPIYVRQYTGTFTSLTRTATLLDGSGNTSFPGTVTATFSGNVTGNCSGTSNNITAYTINQNLGTSNSPKFDQVLATNNGNGTNFKVGDDAWLGDVNAANTVRLKGIQDATAGYLTFGNQTTQLGLTNSTTLTWGASFTATGDVTAYSDRRVKENIKTIENALSKVLCLRGVTYNRTDLDDKSEKIGVIAQEVQQILPQVVSEEYDKLSVAYGNLAGLFIEAIKEQQKQIEELKSVINGITK